MKTIQIHSSNMIFHHKKRTSGWAMVETTVTIALVALLLGVGYMFFRTQRVVQDYYLLRQQG
ncbi:MAG: hypothetical protein JW709_13780, partial [Sedimentisphaerales bacterium]|nr:hypothetical protein [Sedimentisphaerales bacterium]